jgi:transposase
VSVTSFNPSSPFCYGHPAQVTDPLIQKRNKKRPLGNVLIRRQLKRRYVLTFFEKLPPCLVGIEACATSHHWSRELKALGHTVRLMPPAYVKPSCREVWFRPKSGHA